MILGFKEKFPDGTPTLVDYKILSPFIPESLLLNYDGKPKIHSIRTGARWKLGMGIQMAYGVRTSQYRQFNKDIPELSRCIGIRNVFMELSGSTLDICIQSRGYLKKKEILKLMANDGLTEERFLNWFFPTGGGTFDGQIIHWTDFKY